MEWISCKDRLPEMDEEVLVWMDYNGSKVMFIVRANPDHPVWNSRYTHWMPLPEPPHE